ncbi:hypothetical protein DFQ26_003629 [Actinomortierella ambigua]|nr:hypothetical protein DFQ26_003629 [Actinomortierella ambigua]
MLVYYADDPEVKPAYDAYRIQNAVPNLQVSQEKQVNFTSSSVTYVHDGTSAAASAAAATLNPKSFQI